MAVDNLGVHCNKKESFSQLGRLLQQTFGIF